MKGNLNNALADRLQLVLNKGRFLISHSFNDYTFMLYSLDHDLVELLYDRKINSVVWVMQANTHDLTKYLNLIELNLREILT
jgi:hypothetical protein